jgi:hypothetical protein
MAPPPKAQVSAGLVAFIRNVLMSRCGDRSTYANQWWDQPSSMASRSLGVKREGDGTFLDDGSNVRMCGRIHAATPVRRHVSIVENSRINDPATEPQ